MNRRVRSAPLAALLAAAVPVLAQTPLTADHVAAVAAAVHEQLPVTGFAIAVVQDGTVLVEVARGERAPGLPMTPTTLCNIASCSKAFTAAAIALLVQDGKLHWDDRVVQHLPEFRLADPWITAQLTVRDLLCHRSGLVTFAGDLLWYGTDRDDAEVLARMAKLPIPQRFREQYGYQNLMFLVAGLIVQRRSGMTWEEFVEQRLMAPLGMTASRACAQRLPVDAELAQPHIGGSPIPDHHYVACKPAAAICASAHDLTAWVRMWLDGGRWRDQTLLSEASLRELWRPHTPLGSGTGAGTGDFRACGLGWFVSLERGQKLVEHDGGMPGFLSKIALLPAERFGLVVLNNGNDGIVNEAVKRALLTQRAGGDGLSEVARYAGIKRRIDEREREAVRKREAGRISGTTPRLPLTAHVGRYVDAVYGPAEVTLVDGQLHVSLLPTKSRLSGSLHHWHFDTWRVDWPDRFLPFALLRFEVDVDGAIDGFRIDCPIADFDFAALDFRREAPGR